MEAKQCLLQFSRLFLFIINGLVTIFGLIAFIIGIWASTKDRSGTEISGENKDLDGVPILIIIVGIFILAIGAVGFVGAICATKKLGRILLMTYAVVMALIVVMCIAGGIAGYVKRDQLEDNFRSDANTTIHRTPGREDYLKIWDDAQKTVHCCGVNNWTDWTTIMWFNNLTSNVVPLSCCAQVGGCDETIGFITAEEIRGKDVTVWTEGCVDAIIDDVSDQIGPVAGIAITTGVLIILAIVMAVAVALCIEQKSYEVV